MKFDEIQKLALEIRLKYSELEKRKHGREWTREEIFQGFVGDVGSLSKAIMTQNGIRNPKDDQKIDHHLADCLWAVLVLASKYDVDLEKTFIEEMSELKKKISGS